DESFIVRFYAPYDHFYAMSLLKDLYFLFLDSSVVGKYKDIFSTFPEFMRYSISHFVLILKKEQLMLLKLTDVIKELNPESRTSYVDYSKIKELVEFLKNG